MLQRIQWVGVRVSVVIPAYNAAETLGATLDSLLAQRFLDWEAIIVDDGSRDGTAALAAAYAAQDARFRWVTQTQAGESRARNHGLSLARFESLLFLDADDWIKPPHLERLTGALDAHTDLGAVYCGWGYVLPDGEWVFEECAREEGDLFGAHARYCLSVVHTYLVRRALVEAVGGFDVSLRTCPDWDLWQRIARTGARFGVVPEVLAAYRVRANSASRNGRQLFSDGRRILARGHGGDPRVASLNPIHAEGLPPHTLPRAEYELACACAGYEIGGGRDTRALLEQLDGARCPDLDPYDVGSCVFRHAMIATGRPRTEWLEHWQSIHARVAEFLDAIEAQSGVVGLAKRAELTSNRLARVFSRGPGLSHSFLRWYASLRLGASRLGL